MKHSIAIVDDHTLIANALAGLVNKMTDFEVAFIAEDGIQLIEKINKGQIPSAILLDINMPNMDGFETATWRSSCGPCLCIKVDHFQLHLFDDRLFVFQGTFY